MFPPHFIYVIALTVTIQQYCIIIVLLTLILALINSVKQDNCLHASFCHQKVLRDIMIRYDTRCYFNVRSKADMSQLNLPHGNNN